MWDDTICVIEDKRNLPEEARLACLGVPARYPRQLVIHLSLGYPFIMDDSGDEDLLYDETPDSVTFHLATGDITCRRMGLADFEDYAVFITGTVPDLKTDAEVQQHFLTKYRMGEW